MTICTLLVKSEKYRKICLACLDESEQWIRPIKHGGFMEADIVMDNGDVMDIFDVVDIKFDSPFPIGHHKENMKIGSKGNIKFVKRLGETEKRTLLQRVSNSQLLTDVESKYELYDEIIKLNRSIVLAGPIASFDIAYEGNHPRLYIVGKDNHEIDIPCTDLKFCAFINSKKADLRRSSPAFVNSQNIDELKDKQIYFVIGLTGDFLDENGEIKSGKFAPDRLSIEPRYWPLVIGVLSVPSYF